MNAKQIVNHLLENEAEEFVNNLPPETWASFHIFRDGDHSVHVSNDRYSGHYLVYKNNDDGKTRDYIGLINKMPDGWIVTALARQHQGRPTTLRSAYTGERYESAEEAARELYRRYLKKQREADVALANRYRLGRP